MDTHAQSALSFYKVFFANHNSASTCAGAGGGRSQVSEEALVVKDTVTIWGCSTIRISRPAGRVLYGTAHCHALLGDDS